MTTSLRGWGVLALVLSLSLAVHPVRAQQPANATHSTGLTRVAMLSPAADSARAMEITLPSVVASGAPRTYQVVSVPIPDALAQAADVEVQIIPHGDFVLLSARNRRLEPPGARKSRLTLTIGIPAGAPAGHLVAAEARFSSSGSPTLIVPVEIDVSLVRQIQLRPSATPLQGQAGGDIVVPFAIVNAGNARETVDAELTIPSGWASRALRQTAIVIDPGQTARRSVRIAIPDLSSTGSQFIQIALRERDETVSSATVTVEVFNTGSIGRESGPRIVSALSHATDEHGQPNSVLTLTANGALFDSVRIDARVSQGSFVGAAASNALAHLGTFRASPSVVLSAPSGQLSLGNTGASLSDLTGLSPYGQGAMLHLQNPRWTLTGFGALSVAPVGSGKREPMLGVAADRQFGDLRLSSSISHLADAGISPRRLDAVGIGAAVPSIFGSTLRAEIAERRFLGGSGLGWSGEMVRTSTESNELLRITHAPGGSDAFAHATNEVIANVTEGLTSRATIGASAWRTTDATSVFSGLTSSGFSLRPQYAVRPATTLALEMRSYLFDATSRLEAANDGSGFGSRESQLGISFTTFVHDFYVNSSAFLGSVTRTVNTVGESVSSDRSPRNYWTTSAGWSRVGGLIEVQTRVEQTRDRGGFVNQQSLFGIRGEQIVLPWLGGIRAEGELQRVNGFGDEKSAIMRAGIAIPLINGFALKVDMERNSIFHAVSGRVPWIVGARFEHTLTLPMLRTPGSSGYVYEDLNGNQRRDRNEPGVPGAIVRRGGETSIADASGKYRVSGDARKPVVLDEASLPDGWSPIGAGSGDLGVFLSTSAEVELTVAPRSGISDVEVDLSKARVIARDTAGREWIARMTASGTARFDALPVGTYTLEFDLSELTEPLVPRGPLAPFVVDGKDVNSVSVILDPRPIRMWQGPTPQGGRVVPKGNAPAGVEISKSSLTPARQ